MRGIVKLCKHWVENTPWELGSISYCYDGDIRETRMVAQADPVLVPGMEREEIVIDLVAPGRHDKPPYIPSTAPYGSASLILENAALEYTSDPGPVFGERIGVITGGKTTLTVRGVIVER